MSISLTSLISSHPLDPAAEEDPEDILSSTLPLLYPTTANNLHGAPGAEILYTSPPAKPIKLRLSDPPGDEARRLFAHYVWNAGVLLAEAIGNGKWFRSLDGSAMCRREDWSVAGLSVLELGAGTALSSLVAARNSASSVTVSDYPAPHLISNIGSNVEENLSLNQRHTVTVWGHCWGSFDDDFSRAHKNSFRRICSADTLWINSQHLPLAKSMAHFLSKEQDSRVWVTAGFHTGRQKITGFFDQVAKVGLQVLRRYEIDVDGKERTWTDRREGEDISGGSRWTMIAVLSWQ